MSYKEGRFWQPDVTVATIVERDGRFLMVEEMSSSQGRLVINQPAGHLEPNESILDAALRETLEETGWTVQLKAFLGAYQWTAPSVEEGGSGKQYLRFAFIGDAVSHDPSLPLDSGIEQAVWLTRDEIVAQVERLRSPLVLRVLEHYWEGRRFPLDMLAQLT